jgi:hypothetical protein
VSSARVGECGGRCSTGACTASTWLAVPTTAPIGPLGGELGWRTDVGEAIDQALGVADGVRAGADDLLPRAISLVTGSSLNVLPS